MSEPNDIDALLGMLWLDEQDKYHAALTALVAERNKLVEDNASQTYKGNSVCYWHDKANAYKATIGSLWEILESAAVRPDGERTITAALTALVAERDELTARVKNLKAVNSTYVKIVSERDALAQRVAELEAQLRAGRDRDLRERLVCAVMTGLCADPTFDGNVVRSAIAYADEAITEMRKEEA